MFCFSNWSEIFSAGGVLLCVANVNSDGYDYVTLLNMDSTFTTATSRFSCMVSTAMVQK